MLFDFSGMPFFDDHTHLLNVTNREINLRDYIGPFNHGYVDNPPENQPFDTNVAGNNRPQDISDEMLEFTVKNLGVVKFFTKSMSEFFGCDCTPEAVLAQRNKRSLADMVAYTKSLYQDQQIIAEVVDAPHPMGDPAMDCFPTKVFRLFQTDGLVYRLIRTCDSYQECEDRFDAALRQALKEGFIGVKCHVLEVNRTAPHYVDATDAQRVYYAAKKGDLAAIEEVYYAIFCHMLLMTQQLGFPVHLHTGLTGKMTYQDVNLRNPLCFCELLNDKRFYRSHLMFLHAGYPDVRAASCMAQSYPNVWVDLAQVMPWEVVNMPSIIEDLMGFASHGKITLGSGAHGHPEINWITAKVAKQSLAVVMSRAVESGFMTKEQAVYTAECILFRNAQRLYHLDLV